MKGHALQEPHLLGLEDRLSPKFVRRYADLGATAGEALERFVDEKQAKSHSPLHKVRRKLPPIIAFHGKADRITPFAHIDKFARKMRFWRNRFELIDFERADHSFFNFNVSHDRFEATIGSADRFLVDIGFLEEDPEADFH